MSAPVTREEFDSLRRLVLELQIRVNGKTSLEEVEEVFLVGERLEELHQGFARRVYGAKGERDQ